MTFMMIKIPLTFLMPAFLYIFANFKVPYHNHLKGSSHPETNNIGMA